jgi:hypothetical protein
VHNPQVEDLHHVVVRRIAYKENSSVQQQLTGAPNNGEHRALHTKVAHSLSNIRLKEGKRSLVAILVHTSRIRQHNQQQQQQQHTTKHHTTKEGSSHQSEQ